MCELDGFENSVGGEWRRLQNDRIAGDKGRNDFDIGEDDRKVPRANGGDHAEGLVSSNDCQRVILKGDLVLERVLGIVVALTDGVRNVNPCDQRLKYLSRISAKASTISLDTALSVPICRSPSSGNRPAPAYVPRVFHQAF